MDENAVEFEKVERAVQRLKRVSTELEGILQEIRERDGMMTLLDAEHEFKTLAGNIFGDNDANKLVEIVTGYLLGKYEEIKESVHKAVLDRENYLRDLFTSIEDPRIGDEEKKHTDTFGGFEKNVPYRWGLENELLEYMGEHPERISEILEKADTWISDEQHPLIRSSGYRIIWSLSGDRYLLDWDQRFEIVVTYENVLDEIVKKPHHPRLRKTGIGALLAFLTMKRFDSNAEENTEVKPYEGLVAVANDLKDPHRESIIQCLKILRFEKGKDY